jgi:hypothetical protein
VRLRITRSYAALSAVVRSRRRARISSASPAVSRSATAVKTAPTDVRSGSRDSVRLCTSVVSVAQTAPQKKKPTSAPSGRTVTSPDEMAV